MSAFKVNHRGTGSAQYHPRMMLALLIYCYATGSSRAGGSSARRTAISGCASWPPMSIPTTRSRPFGAGRRLACFRRFCCWPRVEACQGSGQRRRQQVRGLCEQAPLVTYERAGGLIDQLKLDIADLMERAAAADGEGEDDPQALPKEIARREALCDRLDAARGEAQPAGTAKGKHPKARRDAARRRAEQSERSADSSADAQEQAARVPPGL